MPPRFLYTAGDVASRVGLRVAAPGLGVGAPQDASGGDGGDEAAATRPSPRSHDGEALPARAARPGPGPRGEADADAAQAQEEDDDGGDEDGGEEEDGPAESLEGDLPPGDEGADDGDAEGAGAGAGALIDDPNDYPLGRAEDADQPLGDPEGDPADEGAGAPVEEDEAADPAQQLEAEIEALPGLPASPDPRHQPPR
ncbi:hypothetical protein PAPYR_4280 [Paratrimastix pyriformis]|uniref:Uncharacterized protein n=1 Tax=Paratrimastix pyriformis TaxID=342808 RepID=A0ABQ8UM73_9EUKA|nr:hypothetical protein PAPYR_4280 [Paratrimastix pyriformis]